MGHLSNDAFSDEVRSVTKTAFGVAYLILKNASDCEDAMSAAILSAYENRRKLKKRDSFRAWFLQILRNESFSILRERRRVTQTEEWPSVPAPEADTATALDLRAAVLRLPETQRNALFLQQEGYALDEIAVIMDTPVGTVKSRLARAKDTLRTLLEESYA